MKAELPRERDPAENHLPRFEVGDRLQKRLRDTVHDLADHRR